MRALILAAALASASVPALAQTPETASPSLAPRAPDVVLDGVLTGADHETYRELPFEVPAGVERVTVEFAYDRENRTVVDLGVYDPERFRGWSGGNKSRFTVAETDATPSYLPGPVRPGTWKLLLGMPNVRKDSRSAYTAKVWFDRKGEAFRGFADAPLADGPRWFRGDLHAHTAHSDGSCKSRKGARIPCPLFRQVEEASDRRLDFVAITEHNTTSHHNTLRELQLFYDDLLLIPGREITTFKGHANLFGVVAPIDFQLTSSRAPTLAAVLDQVEAAKGLISVNHPASPSGELCMGCGWIADTDWSRIDAIEVVNGGSMAALGGQVETPLNGIPFWEARLNEGHRIVAIAGSDSHDADRPAGEPGSLGRPTTVVWAERLDQTAILDGIRRGRVFVDVDGVPGRLLEFRAEADGATAHAGDTLPVRNGRTVRLTVEVTGVENPRVELLGPLARAARPAPDGRAFTLRYDGKPDWIRADVRDTSGRLVLIGNPVWLHPKR